MSTPVTEFKNPPPILPFLSLPHLTTAEHNIQEPNYTKSDGNKRELEDKGAKSNKKRKTK